MSPNHSRDSFLDDDDPPRLQLSRKYHPDAPSTSSMTPEQRTTRFQQLSQSYSVLSDPNLRKSYDLSRGSSSGGHRRSRHHAAYPRTSGGLR